MCCLTTILLVLGPRITLLAWWLTDSQRFALAIRNVALPGNDSVPVWVWALLGGILLPWTTLAYLLVFPGGVVGIEWIVLGVGVLIDLAGHGGTYRNRDRVRHRARTA